MFQIDFMISKRLDVRKVNWRLGLSRLRSESKWAQIMHSSPSYTSIAHHCELQLPCAPQYPHEILTFQPASMILTRYIPPEGAESVQIAKPRLCRPPGCHHASTSTTQSLLHNHTLCSYAQACFGFGGRGDVCIYMHACQAYLRHANQHCSLQNRARVLPSGALFEYFGLSPFFTRTTIYFFTTGSWRYRPTEVHNRTAMV